MSVRVRFPSEAHHNPLSDMLEGDFLYRIRSEAELLHGEEDGLEVAAFESVFLHLVQNPVFRHYFHQRKKA